MCCVPASVLPNGPAKLGILVLKLRLSEECVRLSKTKHPSRLEPMLSSLDSNTLIKYLLLKVVSILTGIDKHVKINLTCLLLEYSKPDRVAE